MFCCDPIILYFPSLSDVMWNLSKSKSHLAEIMYLLKRTRESHWFTPWQTAIFHSLPQHSLHWQNSSLMCSYEIKCFHRRLTISPHSHSFHFIRLLDCLLNGLPRPPGKYTACIFLLDKIRHCWFIFPRTLCFETFDQPELSSVKCTSEFEILLILSRYNLYSGPPLGLEHF